MNNNIIDILKDNDIVVTENDYKLDLLKKLNDKKQLINVKFMTKKEFISRYYFSYDESSIYYLMDKYNIKEDIARVYLDNLYYVEDKTYNDLKLDKLVSIKKELIDKKLLIFDNLFLSYIKNKTIYFYNYNSFTKFESNLISNLKKFSNVIIVSKDYKEYVPKVYEFDTIFEEVNFVAISILKLIEKGINPSFIKITNIDSDYEEIINFIFSLYGIETNINNNYLISTNIGSLFLNMEGSIKDRIDVLSKEYKGNEVLNQIVNIVNKYITFTNIDVVNELIKNEFKKVKINKEKYNNVIEAIDYNNYPISDKYIFMLNFNQGSIPIQYKDEDYISDNMKSSLLSDTTIDKNIKEKEITIKNVLNIENLVITYKKSTPFGSFFPSNLIEDMNLSVIKDFKYDEIYSIDYSNILYAKEFDNYLLYGTVTDDLKKYNATLDIPYNTYDNKFKGIDNNKLLSMIGNGFNLSYSSMSDYYKCSFKYYLSHILRLNIYENTFATYIGSLFHYVLEKGLFLDISVSSLVEEYINNNERVLDSKEKFFVNNLIPDIEFVLKTIKNNLSFTDLKDIIFEKEVNVIKKGNVTVTFKGVIDKIMYSKADSNPVLVVVDYKTGNTDIDLRYVPFGLSMQLPIYLYLAKNISGFEEAVFGGFYLQKVLFSKPVIDVKKSIADLKKENLLLYGYSNSDKEILKKADNTYVNSSIIKSMKLNKDGSFSRYSKVLDNTEINNLITLTDKKIEDAIDGICLGKFDINPKVTSTDNLGCKYCKYHDICFMKKQDEVLIDVPSDLSFLGGDINA